MELGVNFTNKKRFTAILIVLYSTFSMLVTISLFWPSFIVEAKLQSYAYSNGTENVLPYYSEQSIPELFDKVKNSVVMISPSSRSSNMSLSGSGFVFDKGGHMITNNHVVGTASSVIVTFNDGSQYDANVIGKDPVNDIAILKISENHTQQLLPIQFGNSSEIRVGERVIAIGNPYGFTNTLTGGFISQTGRLLLESGSDAPYPHPNMIQTDAIINPGNSGGPLINLQGLVMGMNTATINSPDGGVTGLGFAVPSNTLIQEIPQLIKKGTYPHPWLGIAARSLNLELGQSLDLDPNFKGILVVSLVKDGPAYEAGIQGKDQFPPGDIITALDGSPISNTHDLLSFIEDNKSIGDKITVSIYRDNQTRDLIVTLGERPISVYSSPYISSQTPIF